MKFKSVITIFILMSLSALVYAEDNDLEHLSAEEQELRYASDAFRKYEALYQRIEQEAMTAFQAVDHNDKAAQKEIMDKANQRLKDEVIGLLKDAAMKNSTGAQLKLAILYLKGESVPQSNEKFEYWLKKSASLYPNKLLRDSSAMYTLSGEYQAGERLEKSEDKSFYWLEQAAEHGHVEASITMLKAYAAGQGIEQSNEKAASFLKTAADGGDLMFINELIRATATGKVRFLDNIEYPKAPEYVAYMIKDIQDVARQGDPRVQMLLASFYEDGIGVEQSNTKAKEWYQKALDNGVEAAAQKIQELQ